MAEEDKPSSSRGPRQRVSMIESEGNPFATGEAGAIPAVKVENLSDAKPIKPDELQTMIDLLAALEENEAILRMLESQKTPYLFTSAALLKIVDVTTSVKTRLAIIASIGPRLTDPKAKTTELVGLFRYAEEKQKVEEILKARSSTLNSSVFKQSVAPGAGGGRGGGGRGLPSGRSAPPGGRGVARGASTMSTAEQATEGDDVKGDRAALPKSRSLFVAPRPKGETGAAPKTLADATKASSNEPAGATNNAPFSRAPSAPGAPASSPSTSRPRMTTLPPQKSPALAPVSMPSKAEESSPPPPPSSSPKPQNGKDVSQKEITHVANYIGITDKAVDTASKELEMWEMLVVVNNADEAEARDQNAAPVLPPPEAPKSAETTPLRRKSIKELTEDFAKGVASLRTIFMGSPSTPSAGSAAPATPATPTSPGAGAGGSRRSRRLSMSPGTATGNAARRASVENMEPYLQAAPQSFALGMDPKAFLAMEVQGPIGKDADGRLMFSYSELVRKNFCKVYDGLIQTELELYLNDEEFKIKFGLVKEEFLKQPSWRRIAQKKALLLF